jgi:predicted dithiol-disulfide oxidoreductase (DUF899 family)
MKTPASYNVHDHKVVTPQQWLAARRELLEKEKDFNRLRDELNQARRDLPWEAVTKSYEFDGPRGKQPLPELFDGRSQLIVYHVMFAPEWDAACPHCSFWADGFNPVIVHLNQRDVTMVAISRAPLHKLQAYQARMGWSFKWLSSSGTDFSFDYHASFTPEELAGKDALYNFAVRRPAGSDVTGISVFYQDTAGKIFHTYSTFARGVDLMNTAYNYLDLAPKGRDEAGHPNPQFWVRRHDEYSKL